MPISYSNVLIVAEAEYASLLGWWMIPVILGTMLAWAWLISEKLDKDAHFFALNRRRWNSIHLGCGAAGFLAMLFVPFPGLNWAVGVAIMGTPVLVYWKVRNAAVPEGSQFKLSGAGMKDRSAARKAARAAKDAVLSFRDASGTDRPLPQKEDPAFAVHMLAEDFIAPAVDARAGRLDMHVTKSDATIVRTVDGVTYKADPMPTDGALAVLDYVKDIAGMDIEDRRRPQNARFELSAPKGRVVVDAQTQGTSAGVLLRLTFDRDKQHAIAFSDLGLLPNQIEIFENLDQAHNRNGIALVGAPAGQGLTTSMYALLSKHDAYTSNIKTLEREVYRTLDGVDHQVFDASNPDVDYASALQSILRRDPDIVMADQIEDAAVAKVIAGPGLEGPLIYVPQRAATIVDQIREWVKLVGDVKEATQSLRVVVNQRLVRRLSDATKQPYKPTEEQLKKLNLPPDKVKEFYKASGQMMVKGKMETSPICGGTGYVGQVGVFEVMEIDDECRKILGTGDLKAALAYARRNKMMYLQEAALHHVVSGVTSLEEVMRINNANQKRQARATAKPQKANA